jgi:hypothetical protein
MTMNVLPASRVIPAGTLPSFLAEPAERSVFKVSRLGAIYCPGLKRTSSVKGPFIPTAKAGGFLAVKQERPFR